MSQGARHCRAFEERSNSHPPEHRGKFLLSPFLCHTDAKSGLFGARKRLPHNYGRSSELFACPCGMTQGGVENAQVRHHSCKLQSMALTFCCPSISNNRKYTASVCKDARVKTCINPPYRRRITKAISSSAYLLNGLLLRWTLKHLSCDLMLKRIRFKRSAVSELSSVCKRVAGGFSPEEAKRQNRGLGPRVLPLRERFAKFPVGRIIESRYIRALYRAPAGIQKVLVYLKCRGSVDAIRLLLRHKNVPHAEFYADRSFGCEEIRSRFEAAGLPATLPYFSDNHCEMTGSRTILIYLAKQLKLYGTSRADAIHIESIVDYCFAALHTIWGAECKCAYPQELNRERARAHYCRDEVLPMLQTMCRLVSQAATREEAHDVFQSGGRQQGMRNKRLAQWIVGERIWGFNDPALFATAGLHGTGRATSVMTARCFRKFRSPAPTELRFHQAQRNVGHAHTEARKTVHSETTTHKRCIVAVSELVLTKGANALEKRPIAIGWRRLAAADFLESILWHGESAMVHSSPCAGGMKGCTSGEPAPADHPYGIVAPREAVDVAAAALTKMGCQSTELPDGGAESDGEVAAGAAASAHPSAAMNGLAPCSGSSSLLLHCDSENEAAPAATPTCGVKPPLC
ncbi:uncharacterized protein LOC34623179 [Cyclospora cayetanensis]|uniref:Uncharacterized protein LOC34623179 n=1 Tax=Cyclospora cayetanensis TaxID=88456 RepID=A0A6P6S0M3_9EIME|nr:uncharacterized protein LOC34623179 [Cyclospora cayetanensis]